MNRINSSTAVIFATFGLFVIGTSSTVDAKCVQLNENNRPLDQCVGASMDEPYSETSMPYANNSTTYTTLPLLLAALSAFFAALTIPFFIKARDKVTAK